LSSAAFQDRFSQRRRKFRDDKIVNEEFPDFRQPRVTLMGHIGDSISARRRASRRYTTVGDTPADRAISVVYGLADADPARTASFAGLLSMPFQTPEQSVVPDTNVRIGAGASR